MNPSDVLLEHHDSEEEDLKALQNHRRLRRHYGPLMVFYLNISQRRESCRKRLDLLNLSSVMLEALIVSNLKKESELLRFFLFSSSAAIAVETAQNPEALEGTITTYRV